MFRTLRAVRFLFLGPILLLFIYIVSRMTPEGGQWFKWAALGIGFVWVISLIRVISAAIVLGGLAALIAYVSKKKP